MRKLIFLTGLCMLSITGVQAQVKEPEGSPFDYFNTAQNFIGEKPNADSAVFYIRKLASKPAYLNLLRDFLHNSFAQAFLQWKEINPSSDEGNQLKKRRLFCRQVLQQLVLDTNEMLKESATPIWQMVQLQETGADLTVRKTLTEAFLKDQLSPDRLYANSTGRYALMIYQSIAGQPELKPQADNILLQVFTYLKNNQVIATDTTNRNELYKRAWARCLYAYVNYIKANSTSDENERGLLLKTAFDYSPDLTDQNHQSAYFYDMVFLFGEPKDGFKEDYLTYLVNSGKDSKIVLSFLLQQALDHPAYRNKLKAYYNSHAATNIPFNTYWMNAINAAAIDAPPIVLKLVNNKAFSSKQLLGKWVLVDFWGTWCGPCRKEHPQLQQFYDTVILKNTAAFSLLTIACNDTETKVKDYMQGKHFSFPVAMSDNKVEKKYQVQGYPTKILITPAGKYMTIPFGIDWVNFIKQYTAL